MYLMVEFPRVKTNDKEYSIVYYEKVFFIFITRCILTSTSRKLSVLYRWKPWMFHFAPAQDGDDASPVLTSCDIVKVPDPQMGMVRGRAHTQKNALALQKKKRLHYFLIHGVPSRRIWLRANITNWLVASAVDLRITTWSPTLPHVTSLMWVIGCLVFIYATVESDSIQV